MDDCTVLAGFRIMAVLGMEHNEVSTNCHKADSTEICTGYNVLVVHSSATQCGILTHVRPVANSPRQGEGESLSERSSPAYPVEITMSSAI